MIWGFCVFDIIENWLCLGVGNKEIMFLQLNCNSRYTVNVTEGKIMN